MPETVDVVIPFSEDYTPREKFERAKASVEDQTVPVNIIAVTETAPEGVNGAGWARNRGMERSENRFVAFINADDTWAKDKLEKQLKRMEETGAGMCLTKTYDPGNNVMNNPVRDEIEEFILDVFLERCVCFMPSVLVDTKKVDAQFPEDIYRREDELYVLDVANQAGVCFVNESLCTLDKHEEGMSSSEDISRKLDAHEEFYRRAVDLHPWLADHEDEYWAQHYHRLGREAYFRGNPKSVNYLQKSLIHRFRIKTFISLILAWFQRVTPSI
ncbi:MAG: glycosyltransferase [Candidatus Nanohaloarchaea archaeon]